MPQLGPALTHLIPIQELTPGQVGAIRNAVINQVLAQAMKELSLPMDKLVVRDVRPVGDLSMYYEDSSAATVEQWQYVVSTAAAGFTAVSPTTGAMGDNKFVAFFGIRDLNSSVGAVSNTPTATVVAQNIVLPALIHEVKFNVGGADKVIWDLSGVRAYATDRVAFSPSAVIIPQNVAFVIYYYLKEIAGFDIPQRLQLLGVCVEPRGKTISP